LDWQSFVLSAPELARGETYVVYTGGRVSGSATDGVYPAGAYSDGTQAFSLTLTDVVTVVGAGGYGPGGFRPGRR